jgi:hypothetical protein
MTDAIVHPTLPMALNAHYRGHDSRDWEEWRVRHSYENAADIPQDASKALIHRDKANFAGLGDKQALTHLIAGNVDQPMLEEIVKLERLERLELQWPTLAEDLTPLTRLPRLRFLSIINPRKVTDFSLLATLPSLRTLMIENAKHLTSIDWLAGSHHLNVIGIEGAMDTKQTIAALAPLAGHQGLEAFLGTSLRLLDPSLMPLATCPNLQFIGIARVAKKPEFDRLRAARPDIACNWFKDAMWGKIGLKSD